MTTPALAFDFTSAALDSRITFARSGNTATQVNASGFIETVAADTPRFDFNPVTLACKGLLVEESRSNLFTYSDQFNDAGWIKAGASITADDIIAPDGLQTGDKLIENTATSTHEVSKTLNVTVVPHTYSVYAKAGGRNWVRLLAFQSGLSGAVANFDLSTGAIGFVGAIATASISDAGNGWYRCSMTYTPVSAAACLHVIYAASANNVVNYAGNGTSGIYIWGAQLEAGAFPTSYIPTTTAALTRNADIATITGTNFSDFWQAVKGGASVFATPSTVSGIRPLVQFDDNTANEIIALRGNAADPELQIVDGGTPQVQLDAGTLAVNTPYSLTGWWQTNDCKARKDSGAVVTDTTATIPTVTQARIGSDGTNYLNGTIATINYYDSFFGRPIYTRRKNKVFASLL
jgi:hypothetical protein